jgi:post-segregation antitoxin (ccd killing protein)
MAEINHTQPQEQMILGAQRSVLALKAIEAFAEATVHPDTTWQQLNASEQSAMNELIHASGANSDQMRGFLSVLGEYLHMVNACGVPNWNAWKPAATMKPDELADYRKAMQEAD